MKKKKGTKTFAVIMFFMMITNTILIFDEFGPLRFLVVFALGFFALGYAVSQAPIEAKRRKEKQAAELKPYQDELEDLFDLQKELDDMKK